MCRIAGIINPSLSPQARTDLVREMCLLLQHGGPDDEGTYAVDSAGFTLGHRRLAVIDLSPAGHQPMHYYNGRYTISYNGEIYNYRELKADLLAAGYTFQTSSDTEVILAAFARWGTRSFSLLNGMFAFALWDNETSALYLVRDAIGIKPLYYAATSEGLAFASEIRAFRRISYLQEEDESWKVHLLAYGHIQEPITQLKKVRPLGAGSYLRYTAATGVLEYDLYKQFSYIEKISDRSLAINVLREKLEKSVRQHLISDAPIGVFLSGGLDSGILALIANDYIRDGLHTLSIYPEETRMSEKVYQDIIQKAIRGDQQQRLVKETDFHECLPAILKDMDQPSCDGINTWFISKYAKEAGLKTVLSGIGADELLGGYPSFSRISVALRLQYLPASLLNAWRYSGSRKWRRLSCLALKNTTGKYLFLRGQFIPAEIAAQLNATETEVIRLLKQAPDIYNIAHMDPRNQASWMEMNLYMRNQLLRDTDVMGMAHGIEIRTPFLEKDLVDFILHLHSDIKYEGEHRKQLLIDAFKDIVPEAIWKRPKMGFTLPFQTWIRQNELIREQMTTTGKKNMKNYQQFISGNMHWAQLLSLFLCQFQNSH